MKVLFPTIATLLLLFSGGCSELIENLCRYDADCQTNQYCIDLQCVDACVDDGECAEGRRCLSYQRSGQVEPVDACLIDDRVPSDVLCTSDDQCREELNSTRVFCGIDGRCAYRVDEGDTGGHQDTGGESDASGEEDASSGEPGELVVLIEQAWPAGAEDPDADEPDAGSDEDAGERDTGDDPIAVEVAPVRIGAIIARSPAGIAEAYGRVIAFQSASELPVEPYLQAAPIALDENEVCIKDAARARYSSLGGPGGWVLAEFVDGYGDRVFPRAGWSVEIFAESPICPLGHELEPPSPLPAGSYQVRLCQGDAEVIVSERDCGAPLVDEQQGFTEFMVTL